MFTPLLMFLAYLGLVIPKLCGVTVFPFGLGFWWLALGVIGVSVGLFLAQLLVIGIVYGIVWVIDRVTTSEKTRVRNEKFWAMIARRRAAQRERELAKQKAMLARMYEEYGEVVCPAPGVKLEASVDALPKHRRTIKLRFYDLKRKVCKPFAR